VRPAHTPEPTAEPKPKEKKKKKEKEKKSTATVKGNAVNIPGNIVFNSGEATFKEDEKEETLEVLKQLAKFLKENKQVTLLRIEGHTDNVGGDADNVKLSGERALTIKNWLIEQDVKKERLIAVGFGESKPIADNSTDAGKAQNRRTEFRIAEIKGKKYLNRPVDGGGTVFE
jgi:OOP family OmpA-OmpF porin